MSMPLGGSLTTWGSADRLNAGAFHFRRQRGPANRRDRPHAAHGLPKSLLDEQLCRHRLSVGHHCSGRTIEQLVCQSGQRQRQQRWLDAGHGLENRGKINVESQYCGMLDSNAPGPGGGDVLTINTSSGPLVIGPTTLTFATQGLKVQPQSGQTYINCQAEEFLANSAFTATAGLAKTYQTSDTQANIVAWENDKWMLHVKSASYGASATINNPQTGVTTTLCEHRRRTGCGRGEFLHRRDASLYPSFRQHQSHHRRERLYAIDQPQPMVRRWTFTAGNYRAHRFLYSQNHAGGSK